MSTPVETILAKIVNGNLNTLSAQEKADYYNALCESCGLDPLTLPFEFLDLPDEKDKNIRRIVVYAKKSATDQLRTKNNISIRVTDRTRMEDAYIVTCEATTPAGRVDSAIGVVALARENGDWKNSQNGKRYWEGNGTFKALSGDALANAMMKAETKAKRRVTLSISGLGMLDESELETMRGRWGDDEVPVIESGTPVAQPTRTEQARKAFAPDKAEGGVNPEPKETIETSIGELPAKKGTGTTKKAPKATEKPQEPSADSLPEDDAAAAPTVNPAGETPAQASGDAPNDETGEVPSKEAAIELIQSRAGELVNAVKGFFKGTSLEPAKGYIKSLLRAGSWQLQMLEDEKVFDDAKDLLTRWCELHKLAAGEQTLPIEAGFNRVAACLAEAEVPPRDLLDDTQLAFVKKVVKKVTDWGVLLKKHGK